MSNPTLAKNPTLLDYIKRYTPAGIEDDFSVAFMEYDWTINDQRRQRGAPPGR